MAQAKTGDKVTIHYTGKLEDGVVFASSRETEPAEFVIGQGQILPGVEEAVSGMEPGQSKTVEISSDKAYGPHRTELTQQIPRKDFPADVEPKVGQRLNLQQQQGRPITVSITEVTDESITIDANHPLAGKNVVFDLELISVS